MVRFNTDPLEVPLTPQELQVLEQRRKNGEFGSSRSPRWLLVLVFAVIFVVFAANFLTLATNLSSAGASGRLLPLVLVFCAVFAVNVLIFATSFARSRRRRTDWALLARFADANGLRFGIRSADPHYPGLLFNKGHSRASTLHLFSPTGALTDVGGYKYTTGSGKNSTTHHWHFAAFRLPRPVPHLLLDATANDGVWGNEPAGNFRVLAAHQPG
jgi:hypothetical protein